MTSIPRIRRSMSWDEPVMKPRRIPGARILERESRRTTRPSTSSLRKEGIKVKSNCSVVSGVEYLGFCSPV